MNTEEVYATLVEANPVPDPHLVGDPVDVPLHLVYQRSTAMHTIEQPVDHDTDQRPSRPRRAWITAVAAAIVLLGIGALVIFTTGGDQQEPADQPTPTVTVPEEIPDDVPTGVDPDAAAAAARAASDFYRGVAAGDVDAVIEMSSPFSNLDAERAMWEMNAYAAERGIGGEIGECRALEMDSRAVIAGCRLTVTNPVFVALGFDELLLPIRYEPDGTVLWRPYVAPDGTALDFGAANRAVVDYLREFEPEQYDAVCSPSAYDSGAVVNASGLALTRQCAEVWAPLVDDIANWVIDTGFGS